MSRTTQGRILALDLGEVRIGVAVSDPLRITAQPLDYLKVKNLGLRRRVELVVSVMEREEAHEVVIGYPLLMSGERGAKALESLEFAQALEERVEGLEVRLQDERLTTVQAERAMISGNVRRKKRREKIDSLAAVLILQSFLDRAEGI
jgi:putative Holliday junction resolvase